MRSTGMRDPYIRCVRDMQEGRLLLQAVLPIVCATQQHKLTLLDALMLPSAEIGKRINLIVRLTSSGLPHQRGPVY